MSDRTDIERLDWLEKVADRIRFVRRWDRGFWQFAVVAPRTLPLYDESWRESLRAAIDKAIDGGEFE